MTYYIGYVNYTSFQNSDLVFFKDIAGKSETKKNLIRTVNKNRIPHAQLFLSREGCGGLPMALAFASYLMCENKTSEDSCGHCNQCIKSHKFIHPDIHFSFPVVKSGDKKRAETTSDDFLPKWREILAENPFMGTREWLQHINAESNLPNINVKECNDIMHKLNMMSYESENKILIMWLPEYLGTEGNRLLKLIEEPTDNTYIIMVAENQDHILQTILSRCQLVKIPNFEPHEISEYLIQKLQIAANKAQQIANLSDGNLNHALSISKNEATDYSDMLISWLRTSYKSDPVEINKYISGITDMSKDEQKNFFEYGLHFFRQYIYKSLTKSNDVNLTQKELDTAIKMESIIDLSKAESIIVLLNEAIENINRNINLKILLFSDTLTIGELIRKK
jgi:DNA polymerase III subunit delta'